LKQREKGRKKRKGGDKKCEKAASKKMFRERGGSKSEATGTGVVDESTN